MSPLFFLPLPFPHDASPLFWMTLAGVLVAGAVLERLDAPRSVRVWMCLGYLFGLFYGNGDRGGLAGCVAGLLLGLASAKIAARKPLP